MAGFLTGNKTASFEERGSADFYASPYAALPPLLVAEGKRLPKILWEPSCGNGALVLPLRNRGYTVHATDINDWNCPDSESGVDFLSDYAVRSAADFEPGIQGIVTNPPFNIIERYVERATTLSPYVALLCRLAFLESEGRMKWWREVGLRRVHLIAERLPGVEHVLPPYRYKYGPDESPDAFGRRAADALEQRILAREKQSQTDHRFREERDISPEYQIVLLFSIKIDRAHRITTLRRTTHFVIPFIRGRGER